MCRKLGPLPSSFGSVMSYCISWQFTYLTRDREKERQRRRRREEGCFQRSYQSSFCCSCFRVACFSVGGQWRPTLDGGSSCSLLTSLICGFAWLCRRRFCLESSLHCYWSSIRNLSQWLKRGRNIWFSCWLQTEFFRMENERRGGGLFELRAITNENDNLKWPLSKPLREGCLSLVAYFIICLLPSRYIIKPLSLLLLLFWLPSLSRPSSVVLTLT